MPEENKKELEQLRKNNEELNAALLAEKERKRDPEKEYLIGILKQIQADQKNIRSGNEFVLWRDLKPLDDRIGAIEERIKKLPE